MAGLESIALAVDFLERERKEAGDNPASASRAPPQSGANAAPLTAAPIPSRSSFVNVPRRVSSESMYEDGGARNKSPVTGTLPPQDLALAETLSPEAISRMVEDLADDGEFKGPPMPPPAPTEVITRVQDCDVLCGRGGETNHHSGNVKYRTLVKRYQPLYIMSKRRDKPLIASKIVRLVRHMGGRFLRKDKTNTWRDVGNTKAREKTSQALREGAPDLRSPQKANSHTTKQQQQPPQASAPPSSLGARKHAEFLAGANHPYAAPPGLGIYTTKPRVVEGEADVPPPKKMRLVSGPLPPQAPIPVHGLPPQFWAGAPPPPPHAMMHHHHHHHATRTPPPPFMGNMGMGVVTPNDMPVGLPPPPPPPPPQPPLVSSPRSFAATVSADDDDSRSASGSSASRSMPRGPRLKLLKRRLQEEAAQKGD
ncbi:expressed unknown protein [Seminavis robusta]|uniref:DUF6824 domain-containing protein n=1 Tax=Seminavis robusta TaxID=568900 RepID=A0A9N8EEW9_9STRA|nr:expressed unknown protein [Seminavis robusta]|eukprot:Sro1081_g239130.1 n/a (424) ;mRNA; r:30796-32241